MKKIIISTLLICLALYLIEVVWTPPYLVSTAAKIIGFIGLPFLIGSWFLKRNGKVSLRIGWIFGFLCFVSVMAVYLLLQEVISLNQISDELAKKNVTATTFTLVAIYITLGNSLLEEFFFRWFVFQGLLSSWRLLAYTFSSTVFSVYHVMIFAQWFTPVVFWIAIGGLFVWGVLFCWIVERAGSWKASWIVHIFADAAIVLIGFAMFWIISLPV